MPQTDRPLAAQFLALIHEREQSWDAGRLKKNAADRRQLVERFDPRAIAQPGDQLQSFSLVEDDGTEISLEEVVREGPVLLLFFRFGECPACNIALPHYDEFLRPALRREGIELLAVSPQLPHKLAKFRQHRGLRLRLASDPDNRLARHLGISFLPSDIPAGPPPSGWIGELTGTGSWELPQPAAVILDQDLRIRSITVSPDWLDRSEADEILQQAISSLASTTAR